MLRSLKQNMQVDAYVTKRAPEARRLRPRSPRPAPGVQGLGAARKFDYTISEPKTDEEKKIAKDAGLVEQPFGEASDTEEKAAVAQGFMGLVLKYGSEKDAIKFMPPDANSDGIGVLDHAAQDSARSATEGDGIKHKIGVLSGHDEIKLTDTNLVPSQGQEGGSPSIQAII